MKSSVIIILFISFTFFSSFVIDPRSSINENSFIINGDGFKDQLVNLEIKSKDFSNHYYGKGIYNFHQDLENLSIKLSGKNQVVANSPIGGMHIDFNKFRGQGKYTMDSAVSFSIFFKKDSPTEDYDYHYMLEGGEINITSYGQVGELIEGTYSGKFIKMNFNKVTGVFSETDTEIEIKDGKFSVIRFPDYHWNTPKSTGTEPEDFKKGKKKKKSKKV